MIAMDNKGLRLVESGADVEIQYVLGIKVEEGMALEPIAGQKNLFSNHFSENTEYTTLMINIVDTETDQPVFRASAYKKKSSYEDSQGELNQSINALLQSYPVR